MASYKLVWKRSAEKDLRGLPHDAIARLVGVAENLRSNPYPEGVKKLTGAERTFRVRSGEYRLVYLIDPEGTTVEIVTVGHRKDIYR